MNLLSWVMIRGALVVMEWYHGLQLIPCGRLEDVEERSIMALQ